MRMQAAIGSDIAMQFDDVAAGIHRASATKKRWNDHCDGPSGRRMNLAD